VAVGALVVQGRMRHSQEHLEVLEQTVVQHNHQVLPALLFITQEVVGADLVVLVVVHPLPLKKVVVVMLQILVGLEWQILVVVVELDVFLRQAHLQAAQVAPVSSSSRSINKRSHER
jgi:hypothetical protein